MKKTKSEIDEHIGLRIRECRLSLHLSQELFAKALGVSFQQVQNYEKGANGISAVRLFQICSIFNVSLASMFPSDHPGGSSSWLSDHDRTIEYRLRCLSSKIETRIDGRMIRRSSGSS